MAASELCRYTFNAGGEYMRCFYSIIIGLILTLTITSFALCDDEDFIFKFGYMEEYPSGAGAVTYETEIIPLKLKSTGFCFGFTIENKKGVKFTGYEIMYLPNTPSKITGDYINADIANEGRIIKDSPDGIGEYWSNIWWFDEGDPLGEYKVEIFINDKLFKTIKFQVIKT